MVGACQLWSEITPQAGHGVKQAHGRVQLEVIPITTTIQARIDSELVNWQETSKWYCCVWDLKETRTVVQFGLGMAVNSPPEKTFPSTPSASCRPAKRV